MHNCTIIYAMFRKKLDQQYFLHNFNKFICITIVTFGKQHC